MRYQDLDILTQRESPNNARTQGFAFLVRAGYVTRENDLLPLGQYAIKHLQKLAEENPSSFFSLLSISTINNEHETYFSLSTGSSEVIHCPACGYTSRSDVALFAKDAASKEAALPIEKVETPHCNTIEDLAKFLEIPEEKTGKALLYTRPSDGKFIFAVVRGDMQLSEAKLKAQVGDVKPATAEEIAASGAVAGYASPVGLQDVLIIVDDLVPDSPNLVAGANRTGYHMKNVNYGRDYSAEIIADLAQAEEGHACLWCGKPLSLLHADLLAIDGEYYFDKILHSLAESHHDDNGLTLPYPAAPFDVYLMHIPGKMMDTLAVAGELYESLQNAGVSILFDDRNGRAGVKFNDADLIGCPVRIAAGERGLQEGMIELKLRSASEKSLISLTRLNGLTSQEEFWNLVNNPDL